MERKEIGITKVTSHIRKSIVPPTSKIVVTQRCIQFAQKLDFPKSELFFFNRLEIHLIPLRWQKKTFFWKNSINYLNCENVNTLSHTFHHLSVLVKPVGRASGIAEVHIVPTPLTCCSIFFFHVSVLRIIKHFLLALTVIQFSTTYLVGIA